MALAVVDELEAVEVKKEHGEGAPGAAFAALDGGAQRLVKAVAVGQAGELVVEGAVLQFGLGVAARRDVLDLQDEVGAIAAGLGKHAAADARQHLHAVAPRAAQFSGLHGAGAAGDLSQGALKAMYVACADELVEALDVQLAIVATEQRMQGRVGLVDEAVGRDQRHADRGMREGAVEAAL